MFFRPFLLLLFDPSRLVFQNFFTDQFVLAFLQGAFHFRWWGGAGATGVLDRLAALSTGEGINFVDDLLAKGFPLHVGLLTEFIIVGCGTAAGAAALEGRTFFQGLVAPVLVRSRPPRWVAFDQRRIRWDMGGAGRVGPGDEGGVFTFGHGGLSHGAECVVGHPLPAPPYSPRLCVREKGMSLFSPSTQLGEYRDSGERLSEESSCICKFHTRIAGFCV
jgi:hypothetical protein